MTDINNSTSAVPTALRVSEYIVKSLVDQPEDVEIAESVGDRRPSLSIRVASGETGKVIGKSGRTIKAVRTVVRAASSRDGSQVDIDVDD
jgi:hypothetical protein